HWDQGRSLVRNANPTGTMNDDSQCQTAASEPERLRDAVARFDAENAKDPTQEIVDGVLCPRELIYAKRLSGWILTLCPDASEELRLAARCQHLCRWTIPRQSYPMTRAGYLRWRNDLKAFHARKAGGILRDVRYPEEIIARVQDLNLKKNFPGNPDSRVLEDALCLVFLQYQFAELARKTADEKMIDVLRKSWKKMTPQARAYALKFSYGEKEQSLIQRALGK